MPLFFFFISFVIPKYNNYNYYHKAYMHKLRYPQHYFAGTHLYTWVERDTLRVKCLTLEHYAEPRPGLELRPSDPESSALTISPQRLPHSFRKMRVIFRNHIRWTVILDFWALTFNARIDSDS